MSVPRLAAITTQLDAEKVEELLSSEGDRPLANMTPAERLAQQWRERLAANTMGGARTAAENEEARLARRTRNWIPNVTLTESGG